MTNIHTKAGILLNVFHVFCNKIVALMMVTSIHSIRNSTKRQKLWNKKQGNRKFKAQTYNRSSKAREIDLIKESEGKEEVFNTRNWLIHNMKIIQYWCWRTCLIRNQKILFIIALASQLLAGRYIYFRWYCCQWWMKYIINLFSTNYQTTWSYLRSSFTSFI